MISVIYFVNLGRSKRGKHWCYWKGIKDLFINPSTFCLEGPSSNILHSTVMKILPYFRKNFPKIKKNSPLWIRKKFRKNSPKVYLWNSILKNLLNSYLNLENVAYLHQIFLFAKINEFWERFKSTYLSYVLLATFVSVRKL